MKHCIVVSNSGGKDSTATMLIASPRQADVLMREIVSALACSLVAAWQGPGQQRRRG